MTASRGAGPTFCFADIAAECEVVEGVYRLDGRALGLRIHVPSALFNRHPFNSSAYGFLQQLRTQIFEWGLVEFPGLPLNPCNYTLAQRAPQQHSYSSNPYLTDFCQSPHQDTPPYPTAFWLAARRRYFATWVMSRRLADQFYRDRARQPRFSVEGWHRQWLDSSLEEGSGLLLNREPGLLLIDNSECNGLYHARTCQFAAQQAEPGFCRDTPMYAFNEVGLLHYLQQMDSRRGGEHIDLAEQAAVRAFVEAESLGA